MPRTAKGHQQRSAYVIASLRRSLEILDQFAHQETWSLGDLTGQVQQAKSRVFRTLSTFTACGYLEKDESSGRYRVGSRLVALGTASVQYEQLRWRALPPLQALAEQTGETVHVGILFGEEVVTVQLVEGRHSVRMHSAVGKRSPAHSSSLGKVLLAYYPEPEVDAYIGSADLQPLTPHTITDAATLKRHLIRIRERGYAIDNEERELGLRCVAAPITDHTGQVVASLSVSAPTTRLTKEGAVSLVPKVKESARAISRMLGSPALGRRIEGRPAARAKPSATSGQRPRR